MQLLCFNSLWKQIGQKASYISKKFQSINWLSVYEKGASVHSARTFKFVKNTCRYYLNEV